jgi:hypothetical protein
VYKRQVVISKSFEERATEIESFHDVIVDTIRNDIAIDGRYKMTMTYLCFHEIHKYIYVSTSYHLKNPLSRKKFQKDFPKVNSCSFDLHYKEIYDDIFLRGSSPSKYFPAQLRLSAGLKYLSIEGTELCDYSRYGKVYKDDCHDSLWTILKITKDNSRFVSDITLVSFIRGEHRFTRVCHLLQDEEKRYIKLGLLKAVSIYKVATSFYLNEFILNDGRTIRTKSKFD